MFNYATRTPMPRVVPFGHDRAFVRWRERVEAFKSAEGLRCVLQHVDESAWSEHYRASEEPEFAVLEETSVVD